MPKIDTKTKNYLIIILFFILSRIIILNIVYFFGQKYYPFADFLYIRDGEWYLNITNQGYFNEASVAFFPLLPLLAKLITPIGIVILNNIISFIIAIIFYKEINLKSSIYFLISPIQVFTTIFYTESLFLLLTILAYFLYKKQKYLFAGIILGLSVCCRNIGALLFFSIAITFGINILKKKEKLIDAFKMYIPATILSLLYPIYLQINFDNWKLFMDTQYGYWDRIKSNLFTMFLADMEWINNEFTYKRIIATFGNWILILFLIIILINYKKLNLELWLYSLFTLIAITSTMKEICVTIVPPSISMFRYVVACFPFYISYGKIENKIINILFGIVLFILNIQITIEFLSLQYIC